MSKYTKGAIFDKAVEIVVAYGKGGSTLNPDYLLRKVYDELKKINEEPDQE
jgi:hypothetical protein